MKNTALDSKGGLEISGESKSDEPSKLKEKVVDDAPKEDELPDSKDEKVPDNS